MNKANLQSVKNSMLQQEKNHRQCKKTMPLKLGGNNLLYCTCHKVPKTNCAEGNEAVIDGFRKGPSFLLLEHNHGYNEEEGYS